MAHLICDFGSAVENLFNHHTYVPLYISPTSWLESTHEALKDVPHKLVTLFLGDKPDLLVSRPRHPAVGDLDRDVRQAPHTLDAHLVGVAASPVEHPQPRRAEAEGRVRGEAGAKARA